jgi:hypothetical protein
VHRFLPLRVEQGMTNCARPLAGLTVLAAVTLAACGSSPSYPHAWCAPLITQFHAHETRAAYVAALLALDVPGVPLGSLVKDETVYAADEQAASDPASGTAGFGALASAPADLAKVSGDLKELNSDCGQPASAYKGDNV